MKSKILINASNLHNGGAIQVASSFIRELTLLDTSDLDLSIFVSCEIYESLKSVGLEIDKFNYITVFNTYGLAAVYSDFNKVVSKFDLVFTIFGPNYLRCRSYINVVGFAQAWIIDNSAYKTLSLDEQLKSKLKFLLQRWFFKKSDSFVVELEHVREGLYRKRIAREGTVHVSHNCISSIYLKSGYWQSVEIEAQVGRFRVGFLGRDYPHKNTKILPQIKTALLELHGLDVDFFVTFNESEWNAKSDEFRLSVNNVGSLSVTQCPCFYKAMNAIIFPSLLECFSATPIESMAMEKPLFASDRRFVRDVCFDYALYFDPFDPVDAANVIAHYIQDQSVHDGPRLAEAMEHAVNFSNPRRRAEQYLEIIRSELANKSRNNDRFA